MSEQPFKMPFYTRASIFFIGVYALLSMLYIGRTIVVPLIFAFMIATMLYPVVTLLVRIKINRVVAIAIILSLAILVTAGVGLLVFSRANRFIDSWPILVDKFTVMLNQTISWISKYFDVSPQNINAWITKTKGELLSISSAEAGHTLAAVGGGMVVLLLIPVYVFMILFYQPLLLEFFYKLFGSKNRSMVTGVIAQTKTVIQRYLTGLVIEAAIIAVLNSAALLILGIEYAILMGVISALLNAIPYLGGTAAVALPMVVAMATKTSPWYAVYVMAVFYFIQLIDNNYIVPAIVAAKVKINGLISIIAIIAFGAIWGLPGMFLSIPLIAIVKLIFDQIESLKPWGFLLGNVVPCVKKNPLADLKIRFRPKPGNKSDTV